MRPELIVALDVDTLEEARGLVEGIGPQVAWYKVGKQLFTRFGPAAVELLKEQGKSVFLDLKFHDIPNTVAQAVRSAAAIGADMTNVHAGGGPAMLRAAGAAGRECGVLVLGVTVLTSMDAGEMAAVGWHEAPGEQVQRLARLALESGVPGVVCSAREIELVRSACGESFVLVVPGIRPAGSDVGDQKRTMTPGQAAAAGADYIVVGRPVTRAQSPARAATDILHELSARPS